MSEYKALKGIKIKTFATDLSSESAEGQVFFSTAAPQRELKTVVSSAAWSSAGAMITATGFGTHSGPNSNSFYVGGLPVINTTQHYNGTGWSLGGNYPSSRYGLASAGTQTAGLAMGGEDGDDAKTNVSAAYDGSSWTAGPNINSARGQTGGTGTQTSALLAGGRGPGGAAMVTSFEEWNGTAWVNLTGLTQARGHHGISGPETAAFIAGGGTGNNAGSPVTALTEEFDGSSLSNGGSLNTARTQLGTSGNSGDGLLFAGSSNEKNTEQYNGTSWTETSDLTATHRACGNGAGSISNSKGALAAGAYPAVATTEEWNITVNTVTSAAWASGGNIGTARRALWGGGTQTAGLIWGGYVGPPVENKTEEYNGSTWAEQNNLNTAGYHICGTGTQTAAVAFGRGTPPSANTEEYNGTSWSEQNNMGTARYILSGFGVQTAAVAYGGGPLGGPAAVPGIQTEHYDGTSWTAGGNYPEKNRAGSACGTETAGLGHAGYSPDDSAKTAEANTYDGSSWTAAAAMVIAKDGTFTSGSQTDAITFLGSAAVAAQFVVSQKYDGTSWTTSATAATPRGSHAGSSTGGATGTAFAAGGGTPNSNATEEFTGETTALNLKTLTDS
jgi:hypothetical protein